MKHQKKKAELLLGKDNIYPQSHSKFTILQKTSQHYCRKEKTLIKQKPPKKDTKTHSHSH
jgi:hypothetical protein